MAADPWSRPTIGDLRRALDSFGGLTETHYATGNDRRSAPRRLLRVPAELMTGRGNTVSAMTREISRSGIGLIHRGAVPLGEARFALQGDDLQSNHRLVRIEWCIPCRNGMFLSGGQLLES